jgi:hypothetical protein
VTAHRHFKWLLVASLAFSGTYASAQNLVLNPSFETVTSGSAGGNASNAIPTNWTQTQSVGVGCAFESLTAGQTPVNGADFTIGAVGSNQAFLPTDGTHVLISDQGPSNTVCQIYQDVAVPPGANATLTLAAGAVFRYNGSNNSVVNVSVTTPGGTLISSIYTRSSAAGVNDPLVDRGSVNLAAYAGQTVRIIATATVPNIDWAGLQIDNVRLLANGAASTPVPTMSEWTLILCGMLLLATGTLFLRRRMR